VKAEPAAWPAVDRATLAPVVRAALGTPDAEVLDWRVEPLHGGVGAVAGWSVLRRVAGTARCGSGSVPWAVVLKVLRPGAGSADPTASLYWQREALVYPSGVLTDLPGGLRAPRVLGAADRSDGAVWLWLEEVAETTGPAWPLERYGLAARHLGRFNGAYLVGRPVPVHPWLPAGYLRRWVELSEAARTALPAVRWDPEMGRYWPEDVLARSLALWARREELYAALERLPRTFCHGDANRGNLLASRARGAAQQLPGAAHRHASRGGARGLRATGRPSVRRAPRAGGRAPAPHARPGRRGVGVGGAVSRRPPARARLTSFRRLLAVPPG
jgi:hypothetical protein